jgi:hypothetical protein
MVAEQARQKYYGNFAYKGDLNGWNYKWRNRTELCCYGS